MRSLTFVALSCALTLTACTKAEAPKTEAKAKDATKAKDADADEKKDKAIASVRTDPANAGAKGLADAKARAEAHKKRAAINPFDKKNRPPVESKVVNVEPMEGVALARILTKHAAVARSENLTPFVEVWAEWCPPCKKLEASMEHPLITQAFKGVYLIRLDSDKWGANLSKGGFDNTSIPVFYKLSASGSPTSHKITGGAWGEDTPENMGPVLDAFFHGKS
ncbi:MAG: thioredoxin domain-containing protein [Myxococcota bacterium]